MGLPKIENYPKKNLTLPVSRAEVKYRPFLVKEQKVLLMAKSSQKLEDAFDAIEQVIGNCVIGGDEIDVGEIPLIDMEYLFLKVRCLSKGETSDVYYRCRNVVDAEENHERTEEERKKLPPGKRVCETRVKISINLDEIDVVVDEGHTNRVPIENTSFEIVFKYPTLNSIRRVISDLEKKGKEVKKMSDVLGIEALYDMVDHVYNVEDETTSRPDSRDDIVQFIDSLSDTDYQRINNCFVDSMPRLMTEIDFVCPSCGHEDKLKAQGLDSFF